MRASSRTSSRGVRAELPLARCRTLPRNGSGSGVPIRLLGIHTEFSPATTAAAAAATPSIVPLGSRREFSTINAPRSRSAAFSLAENATVREAEAAAENSCRGHPPASHAALRTATFCHRMSTLPTSNLGAASADAAAAADGEGSVGTRSLARDLAALMRAATHSRVGGGAELRRIDVQNLLDAFLGTLGKLEHQAVAVRIAQALSTSSSLFVAAAALDRAHASAHGSGAAEAHSFGHAADGAALLRSCADAFRSRAVLSAVQHCSAAGDSAAGAATAASMHVEGAARVGVFLSQRAALAVLEGLARPVPLHLSGNSHGGKLGVMRAALRSAHALALLQRLIRNATAAPSSSSSSASTVRPSASILGPTASVFNAALLVFMRHGIPAPRPLGDALLRPWGGCGRVEELGYRDSLMPPATVTPITRPPPSASMYTSSSAAMAGPTAPRARWNADPGATAAAAAEQEEGGAPNTARASHNLFQGTALASVAAVRLRHDSQSAARRRRVVVSPTTTGTRPARNAAAPGALMPMSEAAFLWQARGGLWLRRRDTPTRPNVTAGRYRDEGPTFERSTLTVPAASVSAPRAVTTTRAGGTFTVAPPPGRSPFEDAPVPQILAYIDRLTALATRAGILARGSGGGGGGSGVEYSSSGTGRVTSPFDAATSSASTGIYRFVPSSSHPCIDLPQRGASPVLRLIAGVWREMTGMLIHRDGVAVVPQRTGDAAAAAAASSTTAAAAAALRRAPNGSTLVAMLSLCGNAVDVGAVLAMATAPPIGHHSPAPVSFAAHPEDGSRALSRPRPASSVSHAPAYSLAAERGPHIVVAPGISRAPPPSSQSAAAAAAAVEEGTFVSPLLRGYALSVAVAQCVRFGDVALAHAVLQSACADALRREAQRHRRRANDAVRREAAAANERRLESESTSTTATTAAAATSSSSSGSLAPPFASAAAIAPTTSLSAGSAAFASVSLPPFAVRLSDGATTHSDGRDSPGLSTAAPGAQSSHPAPQNSAISTASPSDIRAIRDAYNTLIVALSTAGAAVQAVAAGAALRDSGVGAPSPRACACIARSAAAVPLPLDVTEAWNDVRASLLRSSGGSAVATAEKPEFSYYGASAARCRDIVAESKRVAAAVAQRASARPSSTASIASAIAASTSTSDLPPGTAATSTSTSWRIVATVVAALGRVGDIRSVHEAFIMVLSSISASDGHHNHTAAAAVTGDGGDSRTLESMPAPLARMFIEAYALCGDTMAAAEAARACLVAGCNDTASSISSSNSTPSNGGDGGRQASTPVSATKSLGEASFLPIFHAVLEHDDLHGAYKALAVMGAAGIAPGAATEAALLSAAAALSREQSPVPLHLASAALTAEVMLPSGAPALAAAAAAAARPAPSARSAHTPSSTADAAGTGELVTTQTDADIGVVRSSSSGSNGSHADSAPSRISNQSQHQQQHSALLAAVIAEHKALMASMATHSVLVEPELAQMVVSALRGSGRRSSSHSGSGVSHVQHNKSSSALGGVRNADNDNGDGDDDASSHPLSSAAVAARQLCAAIIRWTVQHVASVAADAKEASVLRSGRRQAHEVKDGTSSTRSNGGGGSTNYIGTARVDAGAQPPTRHLPHNALFASFFTILDDDDRDKDDEDDELSVSHELLLLALSEWPVSPSLHAARHAIAAATVPRAAVEAVAALGALESKAPVGSVSSSANHRFAAAVTGGAGAISGIPAPFTQQQGQRRGETGSAAASSPPASFAALRARLHGTAPASSAPQQQGHVRQQQGPVQSPPPDTDAHASHSEEGLLWSSSLLAEAHGGRRIFLPSDVYGPYRFHAGLNADEDGSGLAGRAPVLRSSVGFWRPSASFSRAYAGGGVVGGLEGVQQMVDAAAALALVQERSRQTRSSSGGSGGNAADVIHRERTGRLGGSDDAPARRDDSSGRSSGRSGQAPGQAQARSPPSGQSSITSRFLDRIFGRPSTLSPHPPTEPHSSSVGSGSGEPAAASALGLPSWERPLAASALREALEQHRAHAMNMRGTCAAAAPTMRGGFVDDDGDDDDAEDGADIAPSTSLRPAQHASFNTAAAARSKNHDAYADSLRRALDTAVLGAVKSSSAAIASASSVSVRHGLQGGGSAAGPDWEGASDVLTSMQKPHVRKQTQGGGVQ